MTAVNDGELRDLLTRYRQLKDMPKGAETRRGQRFNLFLRDLLRAWGLEAHSDRGASATGTRPMWASP
jgi:hypothetical protein